MPKKPTPKITVSKQHYDQLKLQAGRYLHAVNILSLVDDARLSPEEREQAIRDQLKYYIVFRDQHSFIPQKLNAIEKLLGVKTPKRTVGERLDYIHLLLDAHHQSMLESYCNVAEESVEEQATLNHSIDELLEMLTYDLETDKHVAQAERLSAKVAADRLRQALTTAVKLNQDLMEVVNDKENTR